MLQNIQELLLTYLLHGTGILIEKLIVIQIVKKFPASYVTRRSITVSAAASH